MANHYILILENPVDEELIIDSQWIVTNATASHSLEEAKEKCIEMLKNAYEDEIKNIDEWAKDTVEEVIWPDLLAEKSCNWPETAQWTLIED